MSIRKRILIIPLLISVLTISLYAYLEFFGLYKIKPMIVEAVRNATGGELIIGDMELGLGLRPKLVASEVSFGGEPGTAGGKLAKVKRIEAAVAVLPLLSGDIDAKLKLVDPEVHVKVDQKGNVNLPIVAGKTEEKKTATSPPPIIFTDIQIENGLLTYTDARSNRSVSATMERATAVVPGVDRSLELDFKGMINGIPLGLKGTVGPVMALVEPGHVMSMNLRATAGKTIATITGEVRDPLEFKDWALDIAAQGTSVATAARLAGLSGVPDLGAFELRGRVVDTGGRPALEKVDLQIGSEEAVAIYLTGGIRDLLPLKGVDLKLNLGGADSAHLTRLGLPALPVRGAFSLLGRISDPEDGVYTVRGLNLILGENLLEGDVRLDLSGPVPVLTAGLGSAKFLQGAFDLGFKLSGPLDRLSVDRFDLNWGLGDLAAVRLAGSVGDVMALKGVDLDFEMKSRDLTALLTPVYPQVPVRGAFSAAGKVVIPERQHLVIPGLQVTAGRSRVTGSVELDLSGETPQLTTRLFSETLRISDLLKPEWEKFAWVRFADRMAPFDLSATLAGSTGKVAVKDLKLVAGNENFTRLELKGSADDLHALQGMELRFALKGDDLLALQPFADSPLPIRGAYAVSGHFQHPGTHIYRLEDFSLTLAENRFTGTLHAELTEKAPWLTMAVSSEKFNLKPLVGNGRQWLSQLKKYEDLGGLSLNIRLSGMGENLSLEKVSLKTGSPKLVQIALEGKVEKLAALADVDLTFEASGSDITSLYPIFQKELPLKGAYRIEGRVTDPAKGDYRLDDLSLRFGENRLTGWVESVRNQDGFEVTTDLNVPNVRVLPMWGSAGKSFSHLSDFGPLKVVAGFSGSGKNWSLHDLDLRLGHEDLLALDVKGEIRDLFTLQGMNLAIDIKGIEMARLYPPGKAGIQDLKGEFNIAARFFDPFPGAYKVSPFTAQWGESVGTGWIAFDLNGKRPRITGDIASGTFDLRPILKMGESGKEASSTDTGARTGKVFSKKAYPFDALHKADADLKIRRTRLILPGIVLNDTTADLRLKKGSLTLSPLKASVGSGTADAKLSIISADPFPRVALNLYVDGLEIGPFLKDLGKQRRLEGDLDADIRLQGSGNSVAALMAGLDGSVRLGISDGRVTSKYLDIIEAYFGQSILQRINPLRVKQESTSVNCFVHHAKIRKGMADLKLFLDTNQTGIIGEGLINLETEALDLGIRTKAKKSRELDIVGFNLKELSRPFRLGGTLAKPSLVVDPGRTLFTLGKAAGALALGPAGIAAFFADINLDDENPCAAALKPEAGR